MLSLKAPFKSSAFTVGWLVEPLKMILQKEFVMNAFGWADLSRVNLLQHLHLQHAILQASQRGHVQILIRWRGRLMSSKPCPMHVDEVSSGSLIYFQTCMCVSGGAGTPRGKSFMKEPIWAGSKACPAGDEGSSWRQGGGLPQWGPQVYQASY